MSKTDSISERQIELRREEASKKDIRGLANYVAVILGAGRSAKKRTYSGDGLEIEVESAHVQDYGDLDTIKITSDGKMVFEYRTLGGIEAYVPGEWEKVLDNAYTEAQACAQRRSEQSEEDEREKTKKELGERWGL